MTFNEYQSKARTTAIYTKGIENLGVTPGSPAYKMLCLSYAGLGMGESGEVQGKIKKLIRDSGGVISEEFIAAIEKELGDQLWYIAETCSLLGLEMDTVAEWNVNKLFSRQARGVLGGSGDDR